MTYANLPLIRQLADQLRADLGDDEETLLDTLDGETDILDIADALIREMTEADAMSDAAHAQAQALLTRSGRFAARVEARKKALGALLDATGTKKLERPQATVSRRAGAISVRITDEEAVPTQLCTIKTIRTPDKKSIRAMIEAGEAVPGAELVRGEDGVTVRMT